MLKLNIAGGRECSLLTKLKILLSIIMSYPEVHNFIQLLMYTARLFI